MAKQGLVSVRTIRESEWLVLDAIEQSRYGASGYSRYFLRMAPILFQRFCLVGSIDTGIMGYALGAFADGDATTAWLLSVVVHAEAGGLGVGRALSAACTTRLVDAGAERVLLTVAPDNAAAVHIYTSLGYRESRLAPDFFGSGEDRLVMEWSRSA